MLQNKWNLLEYSAKCGKAALIIRPPKECPIRLILEIHCSGQYDKM